MDINVTRPDHVGLPLHGMYNVILTKWHMQDSPTRSNGDDNKMEADIRELMCYLWDNYLQLYNAEKIFIMGVGYAYIGVKMLLLNRSDASPPGKISSIRAELNATVFFLVKSLQAVAILGILPFCVCFTSV